MPPAMRAIPAAVIQFVTLGVTNRALGAKRTRSDATLESAYDHEDADLPPEKARGNTVTTHQDATPDATQADLLSLIHI